MLRIGICDDEPRAREDLGFALEKVLYEGSEEIVYEFTSGKSAQGWLKNHPGEIDLLFLDVEMKGQNGMETAKNIRSFDTEIQIVFVTGYQDYVFEGYEVGALDYVIKPAREQRLSHILQRVREIQAKKADADFILKNMEGTYRIPYRQILYFSSDKRRILAETEKKEYAFYGKLDEVQERLGGEFVRIHQRYLVNASKVSYIGKDEVQIADKRLPISRNLKAEAVMALTKAMLEGGAG